MNRDTIDALIAAERERQETLWAHAHAWGHGSCASTGVPDIVKYAVLSEEAGEVARAVLDHDDDQLRAELVQTAAVAIAWLEAL